MLAFRGVVTLPVRGTVEIGSARSGVNLDLDTAHLIAVDSRRMFHIRFE